MQDEFPVVSAIITTYKREADVIERAINSIENQTYSNIEIIVVDDNPNESVLCEEIRAMCERHKNVRYLKQNGNKGACAARNLGVVNSKGDFIGCLDDDDMWLPEKVEKQIEVFNQDSDGSIGVVYCNGIRKDVNTQQEKLYNSNENFKAEAILNELLGWDNVGSTSNPLIRRECFDKCGLFWEAQPARQDYEMWIRIAHYYRLVGINEPLFVHAIHSGEQISKARRKSYEGYRNIYKRYKKDYAKYPDSEIKVIQRIVSNRTGITPMVILYGIRYYYLLLKTRKKK